MLLNIATRAAGKIRFVDSMDSAHRDQGFDFVVENISGDRRVLIEIRRVSPARNSFLKKIDKVTLKGDILLVSAEIDVAPFTRNHPRINAVMVHDKSDSWRLASILGRLLQVPELEGDDSSSEDTL